ncbi:MAG: hypothetical protein ACPG5B_10940 [Chitinophagales bacterium]
MKTENIPPIMQIIAALKKDRNQQIVIGSSLLFISAIIVVQSTPFLPSKALLLAILLCMLLAFTGFYFLLHAILRYDIQRNHLLKLLLAEPDKVVWVYYKKIELLPFGIKFIEYCRLHIHLLNRECILLPLSEKEIKELMPFLRQQLKSATFGYTTQNRQLYDIAPSLLQKSE